MSIGELREKLTWFTDQRGFYGKNMHESKEVLIQVQGQVFPVKDVTATFYDGSFVILLEAGS